MPYGGSTVQSGVGMAVYVYFVAGGLFKVLAQGNLGIPQGVYNVAQAFEACNVVGVIGGAEVFLPVLHFFDVRAFKVFYNLVRVVAHERVAEQKVVNLLGIGVVAHVLFALRSERHSVGGVLVPAQAFFRCLKKTHAVTFAARANQGISVYQLCAEPWDKASLVNGVQPERNFGKLHGNGVQVYAVYVAVSNEHLYFLKLA